MNDPIIVGDEGWLPEEWEAELRRRARERSPERMAARRERRRLWALANPERARELRRESARRCRRHPVGSLHGLACTGPTKATGCVCKKIKCYDKPERERAA